MGGIGVAVGVGEGIGVGEGVSVGVGVKKDVGVGGGDGGYREQADSRVRERQRMGSRE